MTDKPTQDNLDLPAQEGRAAWQRHWDRPRPHVALVTAQYKSGRQETLCTYCLDRRKELHPRCLAPGCTCNWHAPGAVENPPSIPSEDPVGSVGLVWRSTKPWPHSRTVRRTFIPEWLDERSSRGRRKETRPPMAVYWLKHPEDGTGAPASPKASKPAVVMPLPARAAPPQPAPANSIYRRGQAPYRFQVMKTIRRKGTQSQFRKIIPGFRRAMTLGVCAGLAAAVMFAGVRTSSPLHIQPVAPESATGNAPYESVLQQVLEKLPVITGPLPGQLTPPCPPTTINVKGACWTQYAVEDAAPIEELRQICEHSEGAYVVSFEDCMKRRRLYMPRMKQMPNSEKPRKVSDEKAGEKP